MSNTSCTVDMIFSDVTALGDATETNNGSVLSTNSLFKTKTSQKNYGTMELNQFVLNGSKSILPVSPADIAFWSANKSNAACLFYTNPVFTSTFTTTHTSAGITLTFIDDYPIEIKVTWYTVAGSQIAQKTFYPDSLEYYCKNQVQYYGKITIEFVKTRNPYSRIKMQYVLYGVELQWGDTLVKDASVVEEIDVTGSVISINTADVQIVDANNNFDIGNEDGEWKSIEKKQKITLTETKDNKSIPCGVFYMDKWSFSKNVAKFSLKDAIGIMDSLTFDCGTIYVNQKAGVILDSIFSCCGVVDYSISADVYNITLSGWLAIQTCRSAMQKVLFAIGAVADCSRTSTVKIYKPDRYLKYTVSPERKFMGKTTVSMDSYVSGISLSYSQYVLQSEYSQIFSGTLQKGDTKISFTAPYLYTTISVSAGTIKEVKTNYVIVTMADTGTCVITGQTYKANTFNYLKSVPYIESGEVETVKKFSGETLCNTELLPNIAQSLLDYYSLRKKVSMKYLVGNEQVGNWISIVDTNNNYAISLVEKQTIDLTGGFISTATCRGYSAKVKSSNFTGQKLYTGRRIGLL